VGRGVLGLDVGAIVSVGRREGGNVGSAEVLGAAVGPEEVLGAWVVEGETVGGKEVVGSMEALGEEDGVPEGG